MSRWRGSDLTSALEHLSRATKLLLARKPPGHLPAVMPGGSTTAQFDEHETAIGVPPPEEIRRLYGAIDGVMYHGESLFPGLTYLLALCESGGDELEDWIEFEGPVRGWTQEYYYVFAMTVAGDSIIYTRMSDGEFAAGTILLFDHEYSNQILQPDGKRYARFVVLADNLAEWVERWITCGFEEWAFSFMPPAADHALQREFLIDHIRLNPLVRWARERLASWSDPTGSGEPGPSERP